MNHIPATITGIDGHEGITIVDFVAAQQPMRMMALEIDPALGVGTKVTLGIKASNIALGKVPLETISISNQLNVIIEEIEKGRLLSSVTFRLGDTILESIITRDSLDRMKLQAGDAVVALVKSSELSILEKI